MFHIFHKSLFAGLEGRNLSNSSITEVFEVNVKFVTTWLNQWKRNNGENVANATPYFIPYIERP